MRILIADDNQLVRRGIAGLLSDETDFEVCAEAGDGSEAVQKARELRPELVLLDISMPGSSGFETARLLRKEIPQIKILILSQNDAVQFLPAALEAGADGCLDKAVIDRELVSAIRKLQTSSRTETRASQRVRAHKTGM